MRWRGRVFNLEIIVTSLVTISVLSTLFVTYPFVNQRLYEPQQKQIQLVCKKLPSNTTIVWVGDAKNTAVQPTRSICGNSSLGLPLDKDNLIQNKAQLATIANKASVSVHKVLIGWYEPDSNLLSLNQSSKNTVVSSIKYKEVDHTYKYPPRNMINLKQTIHLGVPESDGSISSINR